MKILVKDNYESFSQDISDLLYSTMISDKTVNISLTAGATPKRAYELLSKKLIDNKTIVENVNFFNFDDIPGEYENATGYTDKNMKNSFFDPAEIDYEKIYSITDDNYKEFDNIIASKGGLDLLIFGLGGDGHFCANMPYEADFDQETYKLYISNKYEWYSTFTGMFGEDNVPEYVLTLGAKSLMKVKNLVMIVNGENKAKAVKKFFDSPITTAFPASVLKLHPNLTIILDKDAANLL